jgi:hypothetical protein
MDQFKIYVNRLNDGQSQTHDEILPPDFLEVQEEALRFQENIHITGSTYLADDHLISHFDIDASALIPCCICNEPVRIPILIKNLYLSKPLVDIKGAIYDLLDDIRESILIQVPQFTECNKGQCPNRPFVQQFLRKKSQEKKNVIPDCTHFPFSDLQN